MFGIASLEEVRESELLEVNGGRHHHARTLPGGVIPFPPPVPPPSPPPGPVPPPPPGVNPGGPIR
jgi:hypothetical protein